MNCEKKCPENYGTYFIDLFMFAKIIIPVKKMLIDSN